MPGTSSLPKKASPPPLLPEKDQHKLGDLAKVSAALARKTEEGFTLAGITRVTVTFFPDFLSATVHRQGRENGSTTFAFTRAELDSAK